MVFVTNMQSLDVVIVDSIESTPAGCVLEIKGRLSVEARVTLQQLFVNLEWIGKDLLLAKGTSIIGTRAMPQTNTVATVLDWLK